MIRMHANHSHSYTRLILALGIVREPTEWGFYYFIKPLAYTTLAGLLVVQHTWGEGISTAQGQHRSLQLYVQGFL
jgi:hypothetical protein